MFLFFVVKDKLVIGYLLVFDLFGVVEVEVKGGELILCCFDGDNGEYFLLLGKVRGIEGLYIKGIYFWIEVDNLKWLEEKIVLGLYIYYVSGIYVDVVFIFYEVCKYIGIKLDFYDLIEEDIKVYLCGE